MDRRDFIKSFVAAGVIASVEPQKVLAAVNTAPAKKGKYDLVAVMGGEPDAMFRKAIAQLGGMKMYVKKGDKVCIKPNIGWDKVPELAADTNPVLVREIVRQCFAAGAASVTVFDHTCDDWVKCYRNSGIEAAVKAEGGTMMPANLQKYYRKVNLPKGVRLKSAMVHQAILDSDVWFNVPVLKNHEGTKMSISMKNNMGIVWDRGAFHKNDLQQCIADMQTMTKKAALNIVDAYRVILTNGPRGRSKADVVTPKGLFISHDPVAADTAAAKFFEQFRNIPINSVSHIEKAQALKLGTMNLGKLKIKKIKM